MIQFQRVGPRRKGNEPDERPLVAVVKPTMMYTSDCPICPWQSDRLPTGYAAAEARYQHMNSHGQRRKDGDTITPI